MIVVRTRTDLVHVLRDSIRRGTLSRRLKRFPKQRNGKRAELEYFRFLRKRFDSLRSMLRERVVPKIPEIVAELGGRMDAANARMDAADILTRSIQGVRVAWAAETKLGDLFGPIARASAIRRGRDWNQDLKTVLGVDVQMTEPWLAPLIRDATKRNAELITNVSDRYMRRVDRTVREAVQKGVRAEEIEARILAGLTNEPERLGISLEKRAMVIARDQIGKFNGAVARERQADVGVDRFVWTTSHDERVRDSHADRDDKIFKWSEPIEAQLGEYGLEPDQIDGFPSDGPILCRCIAQPILSDIIEGIPAIDDGSPVIDFSEDAA